MQGAPARRDAGRLRVRHSHRRRPPAAWAPASTARWCRCARRLKNGDIVEIVTQAGHKPSRDWLNFVVTSRARSKIRHFLQARGERAASTSGGSCSRRKRAVSVSIRRRCSRATEFAKFAAEYGAAKPTSCWRRSATASCRRRPSCSGWCPPAAAQGKAAGRPRRVRRQARPAARWRRQDQGRGIDDLLVFRARCCNPIRGEKIVGYITPRQRRRPCTPRTARTSST